MSATLIAGPGRPRPYHPVESGGGSPPALPIIRRASAASPRRTPYRLMPRTERPPPPNAAAEASLRAAAAFPMRPNLGGGTHRPRAGSALVTRITIVLGTIQRRRALNQVNAAAREETPRCVRSPAT